MNLPSDLILIDIIKDEFLPHLPILVVHDGKRYTSTGEVRKLVGRTLFKELKAEALDKKLMALQHSEGNYA